MEREHRAAKRALFDTSVWTSHTVVVVDQSGSMRTTDVDGGATRSDAVWLSLALSWVQDEIKSGTRTATDVCSVVVMRDESAVVVNAEPVDWVLFNTLIGFFRNSKPSEGGVYAEAIDLAEACLMRNTLGSCALGLLFFSDGKPSDDYDSFPAISKEERAGYYKSEKRLMWKKRVAYFAQRDVMLTNRIGALASCFGRRLTVGNIGFANSSEEFSTLQAMTEACAAYQCQASFHKPTLTAQSLHSILSNLSSTLTNTKTELTALGGTKQ